MKAGVIGLGHGSRILINAFRLSNIEVYGIASKNNRKAEKIRKEKNIKIAFRNWKSLIKDKNINIVAIAVPAVFQIEILKECLKGNKIILCEKPLGIDISEVNRIFLLLSKYKNFFLIDYIFPEHEAFKKFKKIIDNRKKFITDFVEVKFNTQTFINKNRIINWKSSPKKGGGIVNLFLSHITDYLILFFGKVSKIKSKVTKDGNFEIEMVCMIEFESNIKASIYIDTNNSRKHHSIKFFSKKYQLILKNNGDDYCKNFTLNYIKIDKNNKKLNKKIKFKDKISTFNQDTRIFLTSNIINKLKMKNNNFFRLNNLNRYKYNENILNYCRQSDKKESYIFVNE